MKTTELRIGNIIHWGDHHTKVDINMLWSWDSLYKKGATGEPLTEQWLEKFGFEQGKRFAGHTKWRHPSGFVVMVSEVDKEFKISAQGRLKKIEYVNTLQNCFYYFALTGKELKIK